MGKGGLCGTALPTSPPHTHPGLFGAEQGMGSDPGEDPAPGCLHSWGRSKSIT